MAQDAAFVARLLQQPAVLAARAFGVEPINQAVPGDLTLRLTDDERDGGEASAETLHKICAILETAGVVCVENLVPAEVAADANTRTVERWEALLRDYMRPYADFHSCTGNSASSSAQTKCTQHCNHEMANPGTAHIIRSIVVNN